MEMVKTKMNRNHGNLTNEEHIDVVMNVKMLAIDLDDTLLRDNNTISAYTRDVIVKAREKGIKVIIATGRMYETAKPVGDALAMGDIPMILFSGGSIQRIQSGEFLYKEPIPLNLAKQLIQIAKEKDWYMQVYTSRGLWIRKAMWQSELYHKDSGADIHVVGDALDDLSEAPMKCLIIEKAERLLSIGDEVKETFGETLGVVRSKPHYLEIVSPHVSKGQAVLEMGKRWGIAADEMVAFGNSENDISMLQAVKYSVAVANADAEIKELAQFVCGSNQEDGVAHWISTYVLKEG